MKFIPFIGIFLLSFHFALAQDFRPGYIIKNEGDTIKGWVAYRETSTQFSNCIFKAGTSTESTTYFPAQINGYGIGSERHFSSTQITRDSITSLLFAHVIVRGKATLLRTRGILYLQDNEGKTYELSRKELGTVYHEGVQYAKSDERFKKGILIWKMNDYPQIRKKIERLSLDAKQLARVFEEYNNHFNSSPALTKKKLPWTALQLGPVADFTYSKISDVEDLRLGFSVNNKQFAVDKTLSPGFSLFFSSPRLSEKIWTHIDVLYQQKSFESLYRSTSGMNTFELNYTAITVPIIVSYHFTHYQSKLIPFIEAGLILSSVIKNNYSAMQETIYGNEVRISNYKPSIDFTPTNLSPLIGLGVCHKLNSKLSVVARARVSAGLTAFNVSIVSPAREYNYSLGTSLLYSIK